LKNPAFLAQKLVNQYYSQVETKGEKVKAVTDAIAALIAARNHQPSARNLDRILHKLAQGKTREARKWFANLLDNNQQELNNQLTSLTAATVAQHWGALAVLTDTEEALTAYRQAIRLNSENPEGWLHLGHLLIHLEEFVEAKTAYEQVITLGERFDQEEYCAIAYNNLGNLYWRQNNSTLAESMYLKSLAINQRLGRSKGIAKQYSNLGTLYRATGKFKRAEKMFLHSLEQYQLLNNPVGISRQYGYLGNTYAALGELSRAEKMFSKSIEVDKMLQAQKNPLYRWYRRFNEMDDMEKMYLKSLEISQALRCKKCMANDYSG
jgi:tetratricopeptide (TPR) repeat protein